MNKMDVGYLLDEEVFTVFNKEVASVNVNNNSIVNEDAVNKRKRALLRDAITYLTEELVTAKKGYPKKDIRDINLEVDCVVMNRSTFNKIKKYING